ncbi:MAG: hypothetical protein IPL61_01800 [Myxococcales bacterium]|nr:hypothetical protein [Myxococcales bacterium]
MRAGLDRAWASDMTLTGVYFGIVCQNKDDELKLGRIKVRFPWLDHGDQDQAHWAQIATPMCGNKFGWWMIPDVDDVVAVMFVAGDVRQPVVLGGIWSKTDTPPEPVTDGKNEFRGYKSRCGHRMLLDDSDKPKVTFRDKTDALQLSVGNFAKGGGGPNGHDMPKPQGAGDKGVAAGSMTGNLKILCPSGKLTIEGINVEISADDKLDINSATTLDLKGASVTSASSGASKYEGATVNIG